MNILFIKHFFVGFMVSEILRVSVFGYFPLHKKLTSNMFLYIILYIFLYIRHIYNIF